MMIPLKATSQGSFAAEFILSEVEGLLRMTDLLMIFIPPGVGLPLRLALCRTTVALCLIGTRFHSRPESSRFFIGGYGNLPLQLPAGMEKLVHLIGGGKRRDDALLHGSQSAYRIGIDQRLMKGGWR
jgi:hypothetical protein